MRDVYVKASRAKDGHAVPTNPMSPGYHKEIDAIVYRILDVPETVSEALAVYTFNQCAVLGHTVKWNHLQKGQAIRGQGKAWDAAEEPEAVL